MPCPCPCVYMLQCADISNTPPPSQNNDTLSPLSPILPFPPNATPPPVLCPGYPPQPPSMLPLRPPSPSRRNRAFPQTLLCRQLQLQRIKPFRILPPTPTPRGALVNLLPTDRTDPLAHVDVQGRVQAFVAEEVTYHPRKQSVSKPSGGGGEGRGGRTAMRHRQVGHVVHANHALERAEADLVLGRGWFGGEGGDVGVD